MKRTALLYGFSGRRSGVRAWQLNVATERNGLSGRRSGVGAWQLNVATECNGFSGRRWQFSMLPPRGEMSEAFVSTGSASGANRIEFRLNLAFVLLSLSCSVVLGFGQNGEIL